MHLAALAGDVREAQQFRLGIVSGAGSMRGPAAFLHEALIQSIVNPTAALEAIDRLVHGLNGSTSVILAHHGGAFPELVDVVRAKPELLEELPALLYKALYAGVSEAALHRLAMSVPSADPAYRDALELLHRLVDHTTGRPHSPGQWVGLADDAGLEGPDHG